jgi:Peptidase M50B-like
VTGGVVFAATYWLPPEGQAAFAALATWFLLLAAPRTVVELQTARRRRGTPDSDADQLARLTRLPAIVWVGVFLAVDLGALVLGASWLLT